MDHTALDPLHDFWEASSLGDHTVAGFGSRVLAFQPDEAGVHRFACATAAQPLTPVSDRLQRLFGARRSTRAYSDRPLSRRHLEKLLAAAGSHDGRRVVPSAGGLAATSTYAILSNVSGPWNRRVVKYDAPRHAVHDIGAAPDPIEIRRLFQLDGDGGPAIVILIVGDLTQLVRKYGPRGGRFLLLEAGHAAQNIGLRVAKARLVGTELGSGLDDEVLDLLGLGHTGAVLATAYAVGR